MRHKHPLNSNTPEQTAARVFEHRLKEHVAQNPACQWELDWYKSLKKATRRSRPLIDQELAKQAAAGQPHCDLFITELAKPTQAFELQSPISPALSESTDRATSSSAEYFPVGEGARALSPSSDLSTEEHDRSLTLEEPKTPTSADIASPTIPVLTETQSSKPDDVVMTSPFDDAGKPRARTSKFPGAFLASVSSLESGDNSDARTPDTADSVTHLPLSIDEIPPVLNFVPPSPTFGSAPQPDLAQPDVLLDPSSDFSPEPQLETRPGLRLAGPQSSDSPGPSSAVSQQVPGAYRASVYTLDAVSSSEDVIDSPASQRTATEVDWHPVDREPHPIQLGETPLEPATDETQDAHTFRDTDSIKSDDTIGSPSRPAASALESQTGDAQEPSAQDVPAPETDVPPSPRTTQDDLPHGTDVDDSEPNPTTLEVTSDSAPRAESEEEPPHPEDTPQPIAEIPHTPETHLPELPRAQSEASTQETDGDVHPTNPGPPGTAEELEHMRHAEPRIEPPAIVVPSAEIAPGPVNHVSTSPGDTVEALAREAGGDASGGVSDTPENGPVGSAPGPALRELGVPDAPLSSDILGDGAESGPVPGNGSPLEDGLSGTDGELSQPGPAFSGGATSEDGPDPEPSEPQPKPTGPSETSEPAAQIDQAPEPALSPPPSISLTLKTEEDQTQPEVVENETTGDISLTAPAPLEDEAHKSGLDLPADNRPGTPEPTGALQAGVEVAQEPSEPEDPAPAPPAPVPTLPTPQPEAQAAASSTIEPKAVEPPASPVLNPSDKLAKEAGVAAQRFTDYGIIDDLDDAIDMYGRLAEQLSNGSEKLDPSSYLNLGRMLRVKFEAYSEIADLEAAIDNALMKALVLVPEGHKLYPDVLFELAAALLARYIYDGDESAAEKTQKYCQDALGSIPSSPKHAEFHIILSKMHLARFEYLGGQSDAEQAVAYLERAVEVDPARADKGDYLEDLSRALLAASRIGAPRDVDGDLSRALEHAERSLAATSPETVQYPIASTLLADILLARYNRSHNRPELDRALELLEAAVRVVPYIAPEQPWISERLGLGLIAKFNADGNNEDLDDAVEFHRNAANLTVFNRYRRRDRLRTLSESLRLRFQRFNNPQDLTDADDSLEKSEQALAVSQVA